MGVSDLLNSRIPVVVHGKIQKVWLGEGRREVEEAKGYLSLPGRGVAGQK